MSPMSVQLWQTDSACPGILTAVFKAMAQNPEPGRQTLKRKAKFAPRVPYRYQKLHKAAMTTCSKAPDDQPSLGYLSPQEVVCINQYIELMVVPQSRPAPLDMLAAGEKHEGLKTEEESTGLSSIGIEDFFSPRPGEQQAAKIVVALGVAGVGKTTLVHQLVHAWVAGKISRRFAFVFLFRFQELNLMEEELSLARLIAEKHKHLKQGTVKEILQRPVSVLLIFDGLDQYKHSLDFSLPCSDPDRAVPIPSLVASLMSGTLLSGSSVLLTARPAADLSGAKVDRYVEVLGFRDLQRRAYFDQFFKDTQLAARAFQQVEKSDGLYTLCYNPFFCWMACSVLQKETDASECRLETISQLLSNFVACLARGEGAPRDLFLKLGRMAYHGMCNGIRVFPLEQLAAFELPSVPASPLLSAFLQREAGGEHAVVTFLHPVIQEFLVACSCFLEPLGNIGEVLEKLSSRDRQAEFLDLFLAGLSCPSVRKPLETLLGEFESEPLQKTLNWLKFSPQQAQRSWSREQYLRHFHLLYESQSESLIQEVFGKPASLSATYARISLLDSSAIAYIVGRCGDLENLQLSYSHLTENVTRRLLQAFSCSQNIRLSQCQITAESCAHLASALRSGKTSDLDLTYNSSLGDLGAKRLSVGLKDPNCKLRTLRMGSCGLTAESCADLASALGSGSSELRELELRGNDLEDEGLIRLSAGLRDPGCKLQSLRLDMCELTGECGQALASALRASHSALRTLHLEKNELGDTGMKCLTTALEDPNCKLEHLFLHDCCLTTACCEGLVAALHSKACRLTELDLSVNELHDSGMSQLCGALRHHSCKLEKLRLARCELTSGCCEELAAVLCCRSSRLRELELGVNELKDEGAKVLWEALKDPLCKLEHLGMELTNLTDACVGELSTALSLNRSLTYIELKNNTMTDASVPTIIKMIRDSPTLQKINVRYNEFSEEALMEMDNSGCDIEY
nr:PREDICTED: NACHT, LRR and PYD domains-containing protein 3-like isoform X1 [Lepisosteus oculatus]